MLALGCCVPWYDKHYNEVYDVDSGGHDDRNGNQNINFKKVYHLQNYLLARVLTDRADATVFTEIHS